MKIVCGVCGMGSEKVNQGCWRALRLRVGDNAEVARLDGAVWTWKATDAAGKLSAKG